MNKQQKQPIPLSQYDREENNRHLYKYQKNLQDKKSMRQLDRALRSKDLNKLIRIDDEY